MADPRVVIFGTGSVGITYAYLLSRALPLDHIVTICRSNYDVAQRDGFTMNSTLWGSDHNFKPTIVKTVEDAANLEGEYDYILICSKALNTKPSTPSLIKPLVSAKTSIVLIQNGIAIEDEFSQVFPNNTVVSCVIFLPVTQTSPAVIEHKEIELLQLGTYPATTDQAHKLRAEQFSDLMKSTGAQVELHDDIQPYRWKKLLVNASLNPICALTRSRDMQFLASSDDALSFYSDMMLEIVAVAQECGYKQIDDDTVKWQVGRATTRQPPGIQPSMMADALAGRNMEVEAILGNLVKLAKEKGVNTPILRTTYVLLRSLDDSFTRAHKESAK